MMRRLIDGAFVQLKGTNTESTIETLHGHVASTVDASRHAELAQLAQGIRDDVPPTKLEKDLMAEGLLVENVDPVDEAVEAILAERGQGFMWNLPDTDEVQNLLHMLRRAHARRKLFIHDFGQTPCLPESGINRCLAVRRALAPGSKILLIGDDDLLSLPLAALGFDVTAIDIDPLVIQFVQEVAADENLSLVSKVYDVLAPLDEAMIGQFDAVLTDPMSYANCQNAFLSRALAVVRNGGFVFSCVHPVARRTFQQVASRLPAKVVNYHYHFSAYYYYQYAANTYRSDLVQLKRTDGSLPFSPDEQIPFSEITVGHLSAGFHAMGDIGGMKHSLPQEWGGDQLAEWIATETVVATQERCGFENKNALHAMVVTSEGGHVAVTLDRKKVRVHYDLYPFDEDRDGWLAIALKGLIRGVKNMTWYTDALHIPGRPMIPSTENPAPPSSSE
jgi:hypothetical protein